MKQLPFDSLLVGDARTVLRSLPDSSVDCVITSPPYFRLRNYQDSQQIGMEKHVDDWVHELFLVSRQLAEVLKPSGSFWLNLGDSYSSSYRQGSPAKSLLLGPERLALALANDGWILRNKVIWSKTNPMPTSVRDRLSCTYEVLYFFVRQRSYYFDLDAIRIPHKGRIKPIACSRGAWSVPREWQGPNGGSHEGLAALKRSGLSGHPLGKNPGDVWRLATAGYPGGHHAVFPEQLVERPLLATCPERTCRRCGRPWARNAIKRLGQLAVAGAFEATCNCRTGWSPGVVLDPFMGSGTVAAVAFRHRRNWLGIELNPSFVGLLQDRLAIIERAPPAATA